MKKFSTLFFFSLLLTLTLNAQPPDHFDLRDVDGQDYVSGVRDQQGGTCWTHGSWASVEGNLLMTGEWEAEGENGEPNLAEYHLDWWNGFNEYYNQDLDPPFNNNQGLEVHMGGDYRVTTAYTSRLEGATREVDGNTFNSPPDRESPFYHKYYSRDVEWYTAGPNLEHIDVIKTVIMEHGVLATCMAYSNSFIDYNYNHYQPPSSDMDPNHSVAIVGWDDNHVTQAPEPGAWIVKNSWGTGWGYGGYFWISYYDKNACQNPEMGAVSFYNVVKSSWDTAYYYDYHGWRDTLLGVTEAFNAFTATQHETIASVNFFTATDSVDYIVRIYDDFDGTELSNLLDEETGHYDHTGLHTVDLTEEVNIFAGDDFYVYLSLSDGGIAYDRESEVPVLLGGDSRVIVPSTADTAQSYYYSEGMWKDFYDYDDPSGFQHTGNFCIKALAVHNPYLSTSSVEDPGNVMFENYPNPFNNITEIHYKLSGTAQVKLRIYNTVGQVILEVDKGTQSAGQHSYTWDGSDVPDGLYFYTLEADGKAIATKKMIKQ